LNLYRLWRGFFAVQVNVRLLGGLKEAAGSPEIELAVEEDSTLGDAVGALVEGLPAIEDTLIDGVLGSYAPNALILVDGVEATNLEGSMTPLREGSVLVFIPVTHGG
jgi:molybdopterin converting factor small subunit